MVYLSAPITMTTITIDACLTEGTRTHFTDAYEMYQYFHDVYAAGKISEEKPNDIVEYKWKKVSRYVRNIMEDDDQDGPFTIEESKVFLDKVMSWK